MLSIIAILLSSIFSTMSRFTSDSVSSVRTILSIFFFNAAILPISSFSPPLTALPSFYSVPPLHLYRYSHPPAIMLPRPLIGRFWSRDGHVTPRVHVMWGFSKEVMRQKERVKVVLHVALVALCSIHLYLYSLPFFVFAIYTTSNVLILH